ncbi:MAG: hypothetical protein MCS20_01720, partial [Candidatus Phytoplasma mali]|nr:hypothetical protein [Candidatus Phytoplasma australiense]MCG7202111.1 hypothetical protein [Candidatus Phytoplasma mali]MCZ8632565.1 hypothetical protein [Spiroplasma sp. Tabriz.8]
NSSSLILKVNVYKLIKKDIDNMYRSYIQLSIILKKKLSAIYIYIYIYIYVLVVIQIKIFFLK